MSRLSQTGRSIASNWMMLVVNTAVLFFLSPFVVNKLGSTYYGIWAVAMQFMGYLYLMDFGVRESVIRYVSKYVARSRPGQLNRLLSTVFCLYVPIAVGCVLLTLLFSWKVPIWFDISEAHAREASLAVLFVGLTIAQTFIFNVFTGVVQSFNRFDVANTIGMVSTLVRTALTVILLSLGFKLVALAMIQFVLAMGGGTAIALTAMRLLREAGAPLRLQVPPKRSLKALGRKVFGYGFYVLINNTAQKINFSSDAVVIAAYLPAAAVTPYAIAGSLTHHVRSLMISTAQVFNPLSSTLHSQRRPDEVARLLVRGAKLTVLVTLPISLTFILLGEQFIGLWMGGQFMESAGAVLVVLAATQILSAPHYVVSSVLYGMSKHRAIGFLRVGEAAANLTLSIWLVQKIGIVGVAYGTAISHSIVVVLVLPVMVSSLVGVSIRRYFFGAYAGPLVAAVPFVLGALWLRSQMPATGLVMFFVQVAGLSLAYLLTAYAFALDGEERQLIHKMISRRPASPAATQVPPA